MRIAASSLLALLLPLSAAAGPVKDAKSELLRSPNDPDTWVELGWAYADKGKKKKAAEAFRGALAIENAYPPAREGLASVSKLRAKRLQRQALRNPADDEIWGDLADRYREAGDDETALGLYQRASELDPGDTEWQNRIGELGGSAMLTDLLLERAEISNDDEALGDAADGLWNAGLLEDACDAYLGASVLDPADNEWSNALDRCGHMGVDGFSDYGSSVDPYAYQGLAVHDGMTYEVYEEELYEELVDVFDSAVLGEVYGGSLDDLFVEGGGGVVGGLGTIGGLEEAAVGLSDEELFDEDELDDPAAVEAFIADYAAAAGVPYEVQAEIYEPPAPAADASALCAKAASTLVAGDREAAGELYLQALQLDPRLGAAQRGRALTTGQSLVEILGELDAGPRESDRLGALGDALLAAGRVDEALMNYEKARALDPENVAWQERIVLGKSLAEGWVDPTP